MSKINHVASCPTQRPWYEAEPAQVNFALFPDFYISPQTAQSRPPCSACWHMHHDPSLDEDGLFTKFMTWVGNMIDKVVGNDVEKPKS